MILSNCCETLKPTKIIISVNFHVKDASYPLTTHFLNYGAADFTILFLNTNVNQFSNQSTTISQWEQNSGSLVYLYIGYPGDQPEEQNSHVFSNPMKLNGSDVFFPNVEKFALTDVSFYFRTFKGGPNFKVDPGFCELEENKIFIDYLYFQSTLMGQLRLLTLQQDSTVNQLERRIAQKL